MKKILSVFLLVVFCFLIGCEEKIEKKYELDLSSVEETMDLNDFDISLVRIKEIVGENITLINCDESMFTESDYQKLQTVGTHTVTVMYKLFKEDFTITLVDDKENNVFEYSLDTSNVSSSMNIDSFDISLLNIIKELTYTGDVQYISCDSSMLSQEDNEKLQTVGTHTVTIIYEEQKFTFTITLYENEEIITYSYELDLGYLRDEILIDDFDLNLIVIKETDSKGNIKYIECNETMVSATDLAKLQSVGTHKIVVNYQDFSAEVTITLIDPNAGGNDDPVLGGFKSDLAYYSSAKGLKGTELKSKLRTIITTTHKKVTTYAELKTYLQKADEDPNNPNNMLLFYNGVSVTKSSNMNVWNREHVWPKSLGWFSESGAGADMHHLRPCNPSVNSSRGNTKFGTSSGYYDPSKFGIDYRGDVARIIFYLFTRYTEADRYTFTSVVQSKEMLLEWNKLDPVSETEIIRNNYTYTIQGNRNPFIDHPECADLIWGTTSLLNNNGEIEGYVFNVVMFIEEKRKYEYI